MKGEEGKGGKGMQRIRRIERHTFKFLIKLVQGRLEGRVYVMQSGG